MNHSIKTLEALVHIRLNTGVNISDAFDSHEQLTNAIYELSRRNNYGAVYTLCNDADIYNKFISQHFEVLDPLIDMFENMYDVEEKWNEDQDRFVEFVGNTYYLAAYYLLDKLYRAGNYMAIEKIVNCLDTEAIIVNYKSIPLCAFMCIYLYKPLLRNADFEGLDDSTLVGKYIIAQQQFNDEVLLKKN